MQASPAGYRRLIGMTQKDLAKLFGVSVQSISRKEKGLSPYTDEEKIILRDLVRNKAIPNITIDSIFFKEEVS